MKYDCWYQLTPQSALLSSFQNKMPPKMTIKDLSVEVEILKQKNDEKDGLIKVLDERISGLQQWAQDLYSKFCNKSQQTDQQHFENAKIIDDKVNEVREKIKKFEEKKIEQEGFLRCQTPTSTVS